MAKAKKETPEFTFEMTDELRDVAIDIAVSKAKYDQLKTMFELAEKEYKANVVKQQAILDGMGMTEDQKAVVAVGLAAKISVGACADVRYFTDNRKVLRALNQVQKGLGYELMKFNIGDVEEHLGEDRIDALTACKKGARRVTVKSIPQELEKLVNERKEKAAAQAQPAE